MLWMEGRARLCAAALLVAAVAGCSSPVQTTLPDASTLPPRSDASTDRARAAQGMRDLIQRKDEQATVQKEIERTR